MLFSSRRLTFTSGIEPPVKPTTTSRPSGFSERRLSVKRSPPTGSTTRSAPPSSFDGVLEAVGAHAPRPRPPRARPLLLVGGDDRDRARAEALGHLQRRRADAARGAVHEHGLARRQPPAVDQREVRRVVVEDQPGALREVELRPASLKVKCARRERDLGEPAEHAGTPPPGRPPRSRVRRALARRPPPRCPGTNGSSGLSWYAPRVCSTSGKETPGGAHVDHDAVAAGLRRCPRASAPTPGR